MIRFKAVKFLKTGLILLFILSLAFTSCDETYTPKPKGYFRIGLPEKKFTLYNPYECDYSFELPQYAKVLNYHDSISQPCWKYIRFPGFNGEIFLSYQPVNNNVSVFLEDARTLAYKHTVKADAINETPMIFPQRKVYGLIYDIGGNAASSIQFYATDSVRHFIRGALYFNSTPQPDSLEPVINYLRKDVTRIISTLQWK